jgi:hypothetical protein
MAVAVEQKDAVSVVKEAAGQEMAFASPFRPHSGGINGIAYK